MRVNTETIAKASGRHPWRVVAAWFVILVTGGVLSATMLGDALTTDFNFTNEPESVRADELIEERFRLPEQTPQSFIVHSDSMTIEDPEFQAVVGGITEGLRALGPDVVSEIGTPLEETAPVSEDGHTALIQIQIPGTANDADQHIEELHEVVADNGGERDGFQTLLFGAPSINEDFQTVSEEDLRVGESIGLVTALVVLVVVFGAIVAGLVPIILAIFAISVALGVVGLIGNWWSWTFFVPQMISMMGLAVGIDYSLFIVSRFREERARGRDKLDAIRASGATANRAIFFSGLMVMLALTGMLFVPTTIFRGLAGGAIIVVFVSVAASMTLLPAVLSLLGDRVNSLRVFRRKREAEAGERRGGFWDRVSGAVMRRPVVSLVAAAGLLLVFALPYFVQPHPEDDGMGIKTGMSGVSTLPSDIETKQAADVLFSQFPEFGQVELQIVVDGDVADPAVQAGIGELQSSLQSDPDLGQPPADSPIASSPDGSLGLMTINLTGAAAADGSSEAATLAIERLRSEYIPSAFDGVDAEVLVTGETAFIADFFDISDRYTPLIFLFVLGLSFVLLTVVFRSLVVPAKAIVMNLLSVGAAYGLIVLVFQEGGFGIGKTVADALGFQQVTAIEAWLPLFLFSILFGLSMDYHVFLLTRIREQYDKTGDNAESVAYGLRRTAAIITGAALIMVAVFSGFAAGRLVALQQMGFGLAVAVFLDATVVRSVLVPSTMKLLGDRNWYLPRWLQWLPKLDVEGHEAAEEIVLPELEPVGNGRVGATVEAAPMPEER
ncbi:MAG TPA: MMPL family transporter [Actinomycetota bacterium]